jgi:dTDP-4-amino-4,6-dideoxygalactose transaminase
VALSHFAKRSGRDEILVAAYACFSIPAAAVAAGLRVRLVDTTASGQIDADQLSRLPCELAAALVVTNLVGVPEASAPLVAIARSADVAVVDDAAQALGAQSPEGRVGARGDVGVLSFGRGKPLSALGGGALAWCGNLPIEFEAPRPAPPRRLVALARALGYNIAQLPTVFRWLAEIPGLGIGETVFDPHFRRGAIDGASLCLAAALLPGLDRANGERSQRAFELIRRLREQTEFVPVAATEGSYAVYPRLAVLAPDGAARDAALAKLLPLGATAMYPSSLDCVSALRPHLVGDVHCPGARSFSERLLTLPTHRGLSERRLDAVVKQLSRLT